MLGAAVIVLISLATARSQEHHIVLSNYLTHLQTDVKEAAQAGKLPSDTCQMIRGYRPTGQCRSINRYGDPVRAR